MAHCGNSRRNTRIRPQESKGCDEDGYEGKDKGNNLVLKTKALKGTKRKQQSSHRDSMKFQVHSQSGNTKAHGSMGVKALLGFGIFVFSILFLFACGYLMKPVDRGVKPRVITPFPAPKLMALPQFQGEHKESLYWGTYRPHVYLGIRARTPRSLIVGLMWIAVKDGRIEIRHVCQDNDELSTYGWTSHNGRDFGSQLIVDNDFTLETGFVKSKGRDSGYGGDWTVRLDVQSRNLSKTVGIGGDAHLFLYVGDEEGNVIHSDADNTDFDKRSLLAYGSRTDVGKWQMHLESVDDLEVNYAGYKTPHFHNISYLLGATLANQLRRSGNLKLPNASAYSPNVLVFQITGKIPLKADIAFVSGTNMRSSRVRERVKSLTGVLLVLKRQSLTNHLVHKQKEFDDKFERSFNRTGKVDPKAMSVGKAAVGNLLGGVGYFYGQSKIALPRNSNSKGDDYISYWPAELYTAVPSRSYFPRGFLWDEGFHQLLIRRWDIRICLDILGHWLDLMNIDGWIPREQILGAEAFSKVPEEFVPQHPTNANPPTLFLVLHDLLSSLEHGDYTPEDGAEISAFLEHAFVRLDAWFKWFNTSQSGKDAKSYYWHGRDSTTTRELNPKTLSSGLDDYPRASHPDENEQHLDLRCWMLLAANCMHSMGKALPINKERWKEYSSTVKLLSDFEALNKIHFDEEYGTYFDFGNHTEKVRLREQQMVRAVLGKPKLQRVPQVGYVSLFPFMGRIIPADSEILEKQLNLISNNKTLWSKYGIRSLAKTSSFYMQRNTKHDPPYWRGPIWINMNYMILSALHHYSTVDGPYKQKARDIYVNLRSNLIRNIAVNYQSSGYLWEQYDQETGNGMGKRPFTGWTSLIVLIMAEDYSDAWGTSLL